MKTVKKKTLNVHLFLKTMEQNIFKLCMIVTSHEQCRFTLLLVTFDLYQGHRVCPKYKFTILNDSAVCVLTFIKLGMNITIVDLYPFMPLLVTFDFCQGHKGGK